jgi:hypothetical protein
MTAYKAIGFIGLGVMGEPICRNLARKSGARVIAFDLAGEPLHRLHEEGVDVAGSIATLVKVSEIVFLCLPSAAHVRAVFEGDGILKNIRNARSWSISELPRSVRPAIFPGSCRQRAHHGRTRRSRGPVRPRRMER